MTKYTDHKYAIGWVLTVVYYLCPHHPKQGTDYSYHPRKFFLAPSQGIPPPPHHGNHGPDFSHRRSALPTLELHVNGMVQCAHHVWPLSLRRFIHALGRGSRFSLSLLRSVSFCANATICCSSHSVVDILASHGGTIMNKAALNVLGRVFLWTHGFVSSTLRLSFFFFK